MKTAVVRFPNSNNYDDCRYTLEEVCGWKTELLWHKDSPDLSSFDLVYLPGGFSYGDYLRCGAMAARSPIMRKIKEYANNGGFVLGTCNGFQILCEAGLLPGALAVNASLKFVCKDTNLIVENANTPWTQAVAQGAGLVFPIAHGQGRYVADEQTIQQLEENQQIVLRYRENPNGSVKDIAGICNLQKNVFGLMPHPERATDLRSRDGMKIWESLAKEFENER